ncbi:MAG: thioredoxin fold domain-containing protein [Xanthomonadaceae bacterium]|nr:thioredoxin fold domain-containing protein [Xanthomonadaceae bacterium]
MTEDYQLVRDRLDSLVSSDTDVSIAESPLAGVLQVRLGSEILYMSDDGRYLLQGRMLDLETRQDLTDAAMSGVRKELVSGINGDSLISYGSDDSDFEVIVFTDVDCGYCRRLHEQVTEYNDAGIQIRYAAFPRAGVGSQTHEKMVSVWCAADPHSAMDLAKAGETPAPAECESPVTDLYKVGQAIGVTGTPALVTRAGDLIPGYVPPQDLRTRLQQIEAARAAAD